MYANDIAKPLNNNYKLRLFADDNNASFVSDVPHKLKQQMINVTKAIFKWFKANKLIINMAKTQYAIFKKVEKYPTFQTALKLKTPW